MSQFFASGGQSIAVWASASVLPMNIQDWFPLGWTGWISLQSKDSQESSPAPQFEASVLCHSAFFMVQPSHPYLTTGKTSVPGRKSGTLGLRKSNRRDGVFSSQVLSNMLDNKSKSCGVVQGNFSVSQRDTRDSCGTKGGGKAAKVSQETGAARVTAERPKATQKRSWRPRRRPLRNVPDDPDEGHSELLLTTQTKARKVKGRDETEPTKIIKC